MSNLHLPDQYESEIEMQLTAVCLDCRKRHTNVCAPERHLHYMAEWEAKHLGHRVEYHTRKRDLISGHRPSLYRRLMQRLDRALDQFRAEPWYVTFDPNANILLAYVNSGTYTITLASLGSSSTLLAGQESTAVSNASNLYLDYHIGGKITVGTTPTANTKIEVWAYASQDQTPTYPDVFDGTDSAETVTSAEIKRGALKLLKVLDVVSTTSDVAQWMGATSLAAAFGGVVPSHHGLFVTHNNTAALNGTGGNHVFVYRSSYATVA